MRITAATSCSRGLAVLKLIACVRSNRSLEHLPNYLTFEIFFNTVTLARHNVRMYGCGSLAGFRRPSQVFGHAPPSNSFSIRTRARPPTFKVENPYTKEGVELLRIPSVYNVCIVNSQWLKFNAVNGQSLHGQQSKY